MSSVSKPRRKRFPGGSIGAPRHSVNGPYGLRPVLSQAEESRYALAYKAGDVFSEAFPTHAAALAAAKRAAREQRTPGSTEVIEWEDENGVWHTETASGSDRPETDVEDRR